MTSGESRLKSQIFKRLFSSYIVLISLFYLLYSLLAIYECYVINRERNQRENQIKVQEVSNAMEQRLITAQNTVSRINTSSTIKMLYTHVLENAKSLDSYTLYSIMNDMSQIAASTGRLDVGEIVIFVDDYEKCYTSSAVVQLKSAYVHLPKQLPALTVDTIQNAMNVDGSGRLTFQRSNFLYLDDYTYSNGSSKGVICVSFDLDAIEKDLEDILGSTSGYQLVWKDTVIFDNCFSENTGTVYNVDSRVLDGFLIRMQIPKRGGLTTPTKILLLLLFVGALVTVLFVLLAYYFSNRYYEPINKIETMVGVQDQESEDETERLLTGLQNLIGERNGYRERMVTIAPYARTGMLHGVLTGNMEHDTIRVLCEENYLDLKKPYFVVSVVNFAYKSSEIDLDLHKKKMFRIFPKVVSIFSNDETKLFHYKRDTFNVFLVINSDSDKPLDELFYQIHKFIVESINDENCLVTFGIDEIRDDISELQDACDGAIRVLDGMILNGRGEVYFYEQELDQAQMNYYFPKNAVARVVKLLRERKLEELKAFLIDIYDKNMEKSRFDSIAGSYLIDELHVMTLKSIKDLNELKTTHINVKKVNTVATLEEIFDYYMAVFEAVVAELGDIDDQCEENQRLNQVILDYIRLNFNNSKLSLQYLTDKFGVSNKYISLLCKNEFGMTYLQYVHERRIAYALELLKNTDDTLEKIGELCGYTNQLTFRRNFKMVTGFNPSDYRERSNTL